MLELPINSRENFTENVEWGCAHFEDDILPTAQMNRGTNGGYLRHGFQNSP